MSEGLWAGRFVGVAHATTVPPDPPGPGRLPKRMNERFLINYNKT